MDLEPWEALDVDDSDLSTFLRPCKRRCDSDSSSSAAAPIPGPAGAIQRAMMNRSRYDPLPTQEFLKRAVQNADQSDSDFNSNPWLCALQFVGSQGTVDGDDVAHGTPLSSINKHPNAQIVAQVLKHPNAQTVAQVLKHPNAERVSQVVAVIKSCTPNGFGDMMVTLKDPTGTVSASVHRKVFTEGEFGKDITAGSVLVLQKVAAFSPTPSNCYLNITLHNIVKVFSKDSGPPSQQQIYTDPGRSLIRTTPGIATERREESWMPGTMFSLPQKRTEGVMSSLRLELDSRFRQVAGNNNQRGQMLALTRCDSDDGNDRNQENVLDTENLLLSDDNAGPVEVTCGGGELESEKEDQPNHPKLDEGDSLVWIAQGNSSTTNSVHTSHGQQSGMKSQLERQKQIVNPKSSIPHWTEEQLDELLTFD